MKTISTTLKMCLVALFLSTSLFAQAAIVAVTSSAASDWEEPCQGAFDGNTTTSFWSQPTQTGWITVQYDAPVAYNAYEITSTTDGAGQRDFNDWTLSGSNDGSTWTPLDTRAAQTWAVSNTTKAYTFTNAATYSYYKFDFTNNGNSYTQVAEIAFSILAATDVLAPSIPAGLAFNQLSGTSGTLSWAASTDFVGVTGYAVYINGAPFGTTTTETSLLITGLVTGDKLTVTAHDAVPNTSVPSAELNVTIGYPIMSVSSEHADWGSVKTNAYDLDINTHWTADDGVEAIGGSAWMQFQYQTGETVTGYSITNQVDDEGRDPSACSLEGSNDGSTWTPLDAQTGLVWTSRSEVKAFSFTNTTAYVYYKFSGIAAQNFTIAEITLTGVAAGVTKTTLEGVKVYAQAGQIVADLSFLKGSSVVSVIDAKGAAVKTVSNANGLVSISLANQGIYLVHIQNGAKNFTKKVVVF